jgi:nucleoside 2-deoxyribosyltransferase
MMITIYLAGGLGFSELGRVAFAHFKELLHKSLSENFRLLDPFEINSKIGSEISSLSQNHKMALDDLQLKLSDLSFQIGKVNEKLIRESDLILANLDGSDVDSGTAAEIGFAYGLGKKIIGYRGDFRLSSDNLGTIVNLQVVFFIRASQGQIFTSLKELIEYLKKLK